jgi:LPXTG-site transpeptidase (sortase) family protein
LRNIHWRSGLSDLLLITGALLLLWVALVSVKPVLASRQFDDENYLVSALEVSLPLPQTPSIQNSEIGTLDEILPLTYTQDPPTSAPRIAPIPNYETSTYDVFFPLTYKQDPPTPTPTPTPAPSAGPVIRLVIPSINIDRAVVPLKQDVDSSGQIQYDTDSLFANNNRLDLVGQVVTSVNPGDGSNIILVGHNYNQGWNAWAGVFLNLKKLRPGDKIFLYTENGSKFRYRVQEIVEVPWVNMDASELEKHRSLLWPTADERVTLVTCGGANIGIWSARIYVVAE